MSATARSYHPRLREALLLPALACILPRPAAATCSFDVVQVSVPAPPALKPEHWDCSATPVATFTLDTRHGRGQRVGGAAAPTGEGGGSIGGAPGTVTTATFLYQNFTRELVGGPLPGGREVLTPAGPVVFAARFAPPSAGEWRFVVADKANGAVLKRGTVSVAECGARAGPAPSAGWVRASASGQHFVAVGAKGGNQTLFPVGENVAMPARTNGTFAMEHYLNRLLNHSADAFRLWLGPQMVANNISWPACPGTFSGPSFCTSPLILETVPRRYSLENAWRADWVLSYAQANGMHVHVSLDSWPQQIESGEWNASVYNAANGGSCGQEPWGMFGATGGACAAQWAQRHRYVGARFGAFSSVLGWELINEVDVPWLGRDFPIADFEKFVNAMAGVLRGADQGKHLITTSFATGKYFESVELLDSIDFVGLHGYSGSRAPGSDNRADGSVLTAQIRGVHDHLRVAGARDKPVYFSENGLIPGTAEVEEDPEGRGFHDSLWAPVAGGGAATNFNWWWNWVLVDSHETYLDHFRGVARFVRTAVDWAAYDWTGLMCECLPKGSCVGTCAVGVPLLQRGGGGGGAQKAVTVVWVRQAKRSYEPAPPAPPVERAAVVFQSTSYECPGGCCPPSQVGPAPLPNISGSVVRWFSTATGAEMPGVVTPPGFPPEANRSLCLQPCASPARPCPQLGLPRFDADIVAVVAGDVSL